MKEEKKDKDREGAICKVCSGDHTKNKDGHPEVLIHCAQCTSSGESDISALDVELQVKERTKAPNVRSFGDTAGIDKKSPVLYICVTVKNK